MYSPITSKTLTEKLNFKAFTKLLENPGINEDPNDSHALTASVMQSIDEMYTFTDGEGCDVVVANRVGTGAVLYYFGDGLPTLDGFHVPVRGKHICAAYDAEGVYTVFVTSDNKVFYSKELEPHSGRFGAQEELAVTVPRDFVGIEKIGVLQTAKGYVLYVVSAVQTITHKVYFVSYRTSVDNFDHLIDLSFNPGDIVFTGDSRDNFNVHAFSNVYSVYNSRERRRIDYDIRPIDRIVQAKSTGNKIVGLCETGDIVEIGVSGEAMTTALIAGTGRAGISLWDVRHTTHNGKDVYHVAFAEKSKHRRLNHALVENVGDDYEIFALDQNSDFPLFSEKGDVSLYYVNTREAGEPVLVKLDYDVASSNWTETVIDIPVPGVPQMRKCYSTEAYFYDEFDVPIPDMEVEIWTKARGYIEIDGLLRLSSPDRKVCVKTDHLGKVSFVQYTNKIDVPEIGASLPAGMLNDGEILTFSQYEVVAAKFDGVTSDDLLNAKTTDSMASEQGNLLSDQFRNKETADALAQTIGELNELAGFNLNPYAKGCYITREDVVGLRKIDPENGNSSTWMLEFEGRQLVHTKLSAEEADALIGEMLENAHRVIRFEGGDGFFSRIGSFFRSVARGIARVAQVIVSGAKTVVRAVIDGITFVFEGIINFVSDVLSFIEMIFSMVLIFFVVLFMWIASLFMWRDVKLMQRVVRGTFSVYLDKLPRATQYMKGKLFDGLDKLDDKLEEIINEATSKIAPNTPIMAHIRDESTIPPEEEEAISNDMLMKRLTNSDLSGCNFELSDEILAEHSDIFDDIFNELNRMAEVVQSEPSFAMARQFMESAFAGNENIFNAMLAALLQAIKGLVRFALNGVRFLFTKLFNAVTRLIELIAEILTREIRIPFFSSFYRAIMGEELSWLNLVSFVISVPTVLISRLIAGSGLIPNEKAADDIVSDYAGVFDAMVDGNAGDDRNTLSRAGQISMSSVSVTATLASNILTSYINFYTLKTPSVKVSGALGLINCTVKLTKLVCNYPPIYNEPGSTEHSKFAMWLLLGHNCYMALYFKQREGHDIEENGCGDLYAFISGCFYTAFAIWYAAESNMKKPWVFVKEIMVGIKDMIKLIIFLHLNNEPVGKLAWAVHVANVLNLIAAAAGGIIETIRINGNDEDNGNASYASVQPALS